MNGSKIPSWASLLVILVASLSCVERHPLQPRVPEPQMEQASRLTAPYGDAQTAPPAIVIEGKQLYEGKGACALCHGLSGKGDGPAAHLHNPHPPRDFTDCTVQQARKDGELFWVIKHGSPGTGMVPLVPGILTEDEAWKIVAYVRSFCKKPA
ncbi:MAG: cytochrome c [Nitrospirae bacterium]|nr:MAG: cytochrome c [Nitrospirota bacterium]